MTDGISLKDLADLSETQFAALRDLRVSDHQEVLGKSFHESIADWENAPQGEALALCVLLDEKPIGMTVFRQPKPRSRKVSIHGLKIATPWQRRGFGHCAFRLAVAHMTSAWPDAELLKLSVDAENAPALAIYRGAGMRDSGPVFDGANGKEHRMEVALKQ